LRPIQQAIPGKLALLYRELFMSLVRTLLTPQEAALYLGISVNTLSVWRSTGRYDLPFIKIGGKVKYRESDLAAFIEKRTCTHVA
jgi:excisionase family DNA binding protein